MTEFGGAVGGGNTYLTLEAFLKKLPDGIYACRKGKLYKAKFPEMIDGDVVMKFDEISEDIQHVGYTQEACGYNK